MADDADAREGARGGPGLGERDGGVSIEPLRTRSAGRSRSARSRVRPAVSSSLWGGVPPGEAVRREAREGGVEAAAGLVGQGSPVGATTSLASVAHDGGARWVIASRWEARDDVFGRVMAALYPALANGVDVRTALDAARRTVNDRTPSAAPFLAAVTLSVRSLADLNRPPLRCPAAP